MVRKLMPLLAAWNPGLKNTVTILERHKVLVKRS